MNFVKNSLSRVSGIFGNVTDHSASQATDQQSPMPGILDAEISLHASRPARNVPRARVKSQAQTNLDVKRKIFEAGYKSDPYQIPDEEDEIEEIDLPNLSTYHEQKNTANLTRQQQHGSRALGQSREAAEEERLLGPGRRRSSAQADAVAVDVPTYEMPPRWKVPFVGGGGGLRPVNTLNDKGKSELIREKRMTGQRVPTKSQYEKSSTPRKSSLAYVNEAEGSPPRKKQRTNTGHQDVQPSTNSAEQDDNDADPLHSADVMVVSARTKTPASKSAIKTTPLRALARPNSAEVKVRESKDSAVTFNRGATLERRQEEAKQSGKVFQRMEQSHSRKAAVTPRFSKLENRLRGDRADSGSPDMLQVVSISPPAPDYPRVDLELFFCKGLGADDSNCYMLARDSDVQIGYRNEQLSKDALFTLRFSKIRSCRLANDNGGPSIMQLRLSSGSVPSNVCYMIFGSHKVAVDFINLIHRHVPDFEVSFRDPTWMSDALGAARATSQEVSRADRAQFERRNHPEQISDTAAASLARESPQTLRKKLGRLDASDKPPEQQATNSTRQDAEKVVRVRRTTRSRPSGGADHYEIFSEAQDLKNDRPSSKRARSGTIQKAEIDEEPPREKPEPRVTGPVWSKPLTYPPTGPKKQTVEWADLKRLEDEELLNDSIVGVFLRYIQENADKAYAPQIHTMSTFFYEALMRPIDGKTNRKQINYAAVSKWTKSVDIFQRDFVIVPINESLHWYTLLICNLGALTVPKCPIELASSEDEDLIEEQPIVPGNFPTEVSKVILESDLNNKQSDGDRADSEYEASKNTSRGPKKKPPRAQRKYDVAQPVIITLDSLDTGGRSSTASMLKDYVIEEGKQKRTLSIDKGDIKGMTAKGIPHQGNFYDCGLYVCLYLERFMANPRKFVDALLTRENSALPWPRRLSSSVMRQRFYDFLQELYHAQETGATPCVPEVGKILIHDEDYNQPDVKTALSRGRMKEVDLEKMKKGLDFAEDYYRNPNRDHNEDLEMEDRTVVASDEHHPEEFINSVEEYLMQENGLVLIDDDIKPTSPDQHEAVKSAYFTRPEIPVALQEADKFDTPQELAYSLRDRRESAGRQKKCKDVIDLSSPGGQHMLPHDIGTEQDIRARSVSTDFLSGDRSYQNGNNDKIQHKTSKRQIPSERSPVKRTGVTAVVSNSQPDKVEAESRQLSSSAYEGGSRMDGDAHHHVRKDRDASVVPESQYGDQIYDSDDDVEMIESRPIQHGTDHDSEMLLN